MASQPSREVTLDRLRGKASKELFDDFLTYFGISEDMDMDGNTRWSVNVTSDPSISISNKAFLAPSHKKWQFDWTISAVDNNLSTTVSLKSTRASSPLPPHSERYGAPKRQQLDSPSWVDTLPNTEHVDFFKSVDWASTPLGGLSSWPMSLRLYTQVCFTDRQASALYWGPERIAIYNESFTMLIGGKHPSFMGMSFWSSWPEIWEQFNAIFKQLDDTGMGITLADYPLFLERHNYTEETWWVGDLVPFKDENGTVAGAYFTWNETTRQILTDRRAKLINDIGKPGPDQGEDAVWSHIHAVFSRYPRDVPMGMLYSTDNGAEGEHCKLTCRGRIGYSTSDVAAPGSIDLAKTTNGFGPTLRQAKEGKDDWVGIDPYDGQFPRETLDSVDWQGYGEPSKTIVVMPLTVVNRLLKGFVIMGVNPRRAFDLDHQQFVSDLSRQLSAVMTSMTTVEQAKKREDQLMRDLADSEKRIRRMAELAPVGMYDLSVDGPLLWANEHFFDIVGLPDMKKDPSKFDWGLCIEKEDHVNAQREMQRSIQDHVGIADELRLNRKWVPPSTPNGHENVEEEPAWVLYQAYPSIENGEVKSFMGCITDISHLKWAENVQTRAATESKEARRRQEEFIDVTSHEMRNPLSAISQCADAVSSSLSEAESVNNDTHALMEIVRANVEAADSILLCAAHQRRIIDDVLTLSKLDSALLSITASPFRPHSMLNEAMQMFHGEFKASEISVQTINELSEVMRGEELVYSDPSRLMQVLVNLLTNAIKFTRSEKSRTITIRVGASMSPPSPTMFGAKFQWSPTQQDRKDLTDDSSYGQGEPIYLYFSVQDSGQGIKSEKAVHIFDKFIQASRRTHIKYGGSGLGLFISRELTEMQGGLIGVGSAQGDGSTFAFFVKAKRDTRVSLPIMPKKPKYKRTSTSDPSDSPPQPSSKLNSHVEELQGQDRNLPSPAKRQKPRAANYDILLVEDNLVNQKVLAKQLRKTGCRVAVANHGGEAIDFLLKMDGQDLEYGMSMSDGTSTPDLSAAPTMTDAVPTKLDFILMDWEMPIIDGLAATRRIRELEQEGKIKQRHFIMGVTANARSEQIQTAKDAGMDDVMPKPFLVPELMEKIDTVLG